MDDEDEYLDDDALQAEIARLRDDADSSDDDDPIGAVDPPPEAPNVSYASPAFRGGRSAANGTTPRESESDPPPYTGSDPVESLKSERYLAALKKARALNVQLQKEKATNTKLTAQLVRVERELLDAREPNILPSAHAPSIRGGASDTRSVLPGGDLELEERCKDLSVKWDKANRTIVELRRQNQLMVAEGKKVRTILTKELGDGVDVEKVLAGEEGQQQQQQQQGVAWRGRAQQVTLLRAKVKELQKALRAASGEGGGTLAVGDDGATTVSGMTGMTGYTSSTTRDYDDVNRDHLERMSNAKLKVKSEATQQLQVKERELKDSREKSDALTARVATLEKQSTDLKWKLHRVIEKTENDDKLIQTYKQELENLRRQPAASAAPQGRPPPPPTPNNPVDRIPVTTRNYFG